MASGFYVYTPLIAALAGASHVLAIVKPSDYAAPEKVIDRGLALANCWKVHDRIEVVEDLAASVISRADIVTNLGFVRPIDATFIAAMKHGAVIPYMREAWEFRPGDVDVTACQEKNIPVMGTNEAIEDLAIFDYSGTLAIKMLFEAGLEVRNNHILVISQDKFGKVISSALADCGASVSLSQEAIEVNLARIERLDAVLVANYSPKELLVGPHGWVEPSILASKHPGCIVVQFTGNVDVASLIEHNVNCYPASAVEPYRMSKTLADLGPKPVIELHAAGLKVGELMWRRMRELRDANQVEKVLASEQALCQRMPRSHI